MLKVEEGSKDGSASFGMTGEEINNGEKEDAVEEAIVLKVDVINKDESGVEEDGGKDDLSPGPGAHLNMGKIAVEGIEEDKLGEDDGEALVSDTPDGVVV